MAGFLTGLVRGTVMCGATLAALSLAFPPQDAGPIDAAAKAPTSPAADLPETGTRPDAGPSPAGLPADEAAKGGAPGDASIAADGREAAPAVDAGVATRAAVRPTGPAAEALPEPVGSEFRRSGDLAPAAPAPLTARSDASAESPAAFAPAAEPEPAPPSTPLRRPAAGELPQAPASLAATPARPEELPAPASEAPIPVPPPGRVVVPSLDRLPERGTAVGESAEGADGAEGSMPPQAASPSSSAGVVTPARVADDAPRSPSGLSGTAASSGLATPGGASRIGAGPAAAADVPRPAPNLSLPALGSAARAPRLPQPSVAPTDTPDLSDLRPAQGNRDAAP